MSWFDFGAVVIVALAVFDGARSGLAWAALECALLVTAAIAARGLHGEVEPYVLKVADLGPDDLRAASHLIVFAAFAALFAGVLILVHPASRRWRFRHDAWFGGVLGFANGLCAALVLFSIAMWSRPRPAIEEALASSRLVPVLRSVHGSGLSGIFPEQVPERLEQLERP
jgi:hypothetical protein